MRTVILASVVALGALAAGCGKKVDHPAYPGTLDGAKQVTGDFVKAGADLPKLSRGLRPDPEDYAAVFDAETATKLKAGMDPLWDKGVSIRPAKPTQTEILMLGGATVDELKAGTSENAKHCPNLYKDLATHMKPGITVYCFKFVEPGQKVGTAFDGLVHVNGHWAMFPKPWTVLK